MDLSILKKFETEKGKLCILLNNDHKYREYKILKNLGSIRYRCTNKSCQSSIYVDNDVTKVLNVLNEHKHNIIPKNIVSRQIVNSQIKRKCENDLFTRQNIIIRQELCSNENDLHTVHSDIKLWRKSMYDFRKKIYQKFQNHWKNPNFNYLTYVILLKLIYRNIFAAWKKFQI